METGDLKVCKIVIEFEVAAFCEPYEGSITKWAREKFHEGVRDKIFEIAKEQRCVASTPRTLSISDTKEE